MRNKVFILSEDLQFFYRLNKELEKLKIRFKILNFWNKIPEIPCVIITTEEEINKIKNPSEILVKILVFGKEDNFEQYIIRILAAYKIGYKNNYTSLLFSIDPGTKHIGLAIFLDDYYLISHTIYDVDNLVEKIKNYIDAFNNDLISIVFKFGRGILPTCIDLIERILNEFENKPIIRTYLIDEAKSSKLKIRFRDRMFPKDEVSAIILALRKGNEISRESYLNNCKIIVNKDEFINEKYNNDKDSFEDLGEIIQKILNGELSITKSVALLNPYNNSD